MSVGLADLKPVYESVALPELTETLRQVFRTADQAIVMLAVQSVDNREQNRHFESAQQLRIIHRSMMQRFVEHWFSPLSDKPLHIDADIEHINSLRKLMSQSQAIEDITDASDLLNPAHIHNSFLLSLAEADLDVHSKMLVLRAFETRLNDDLPAFREKAGVALSQLGVKAQPVVVKAVVAPVSNFDGNSGFALALADLQAIDYDVLETRLSPAVLFAFQPPAQARDLLQELQQGKLLKTPVASNEESIAQDIRQLFAIIQADQRLSIPARALLSYLQLPYTRIALQDPQFFSDEKNLAKSLLNELVRLAGLWQPNNEQLALDPFYQKVAEIITTFWEAERIALVPYQQMLFDLLLYGETERQQHAVTSQRFQESQQGAIQSARIREQVDQLVAEKFAQLNVTAATEQLLEQGWKHVLYLAGLRYGTESEDWHNAAEVLDQLAQTLQAPDYYRSRTDFLIRLPALLRKLREGLLFIQLAPSVINQLFAELESEHKKLAMRISDSDLDDKALEAARDAAKTLHLDLGKSDVLQVSLLNETLEQQPVVNTVVDVEAVEEVTAVQKVELVESFQSEESLQSKEPEQSNNPLDVQSVQVEAFDNHAAISEPVLDVIAAESVVLDATALEGIAQESLVAEAEPVDPQLQIAQDKLAALGQGSLIVWNRESGQERCRIAAFIKHTRKYILTGRGGAKVAEWTHDEMLEKLISGELESLETGQIFERALESVIGRIRENR